MADRPNILVVLTDDHAQWALGCYGNREIRSPTMDWLAGRGVRMANAMTEGPVCSPARASFWTGRLPSQHGIHDFLGSREHRDQPWLEGETLLGELLHDAGYDCGFFGKWHCGRPAKTRTGFQRWCCIGARTGPHQGDQPYIIDGQEVALHGYQARLTTDMALDWLQNRAAETSGGDNGGETDEADGERTPNRPFFAFVGLVSTHSPYDHHPPRLVEQYRDAAFEEIPDDATHPIGRVRPEGAYRRSDWNHHRRQYYAAVSEIDEQLGRLVDHLDQAGELDNTLIVYTGDHGLNCGHHGLWGKANATRPVNFVEETIRIPMVFAGWDKLHDQQVRPEFVDHTDLFATLVEVGGAAPPTDRRYAGRSFAHLLTAGPAEFDWKQNHVAEYGDARMARSATHKLIRRHGRAPDELYDLLADPRETGNVIESPDQQRAVAELDAVLGATFDPIADSPNSGLRVAELPEHNDVEPWRGEPV